MRVAIVENTGIAHHGKVGVAAPPSSTFTSPEPASLARRPDADALIVFGGERAATGDHTHPYPPSLTRLMAA